MKLKELLIREYAGPPVRVAVNIMFVACLGILLGHWFFGAPLDDRLVMASMTPALIAIILAALAKDGAPG